MVRMFKDATKMNDSDYTGIRLRSIPIVVMVLSRRSGQPIRVMQSAGRCGRNGISGATGVFLAFVALCGPGGLHPSGAIRKHRQPLYLKLKLIPQK